MKPLFLILMLGGCACTALVLCQRLHAAKLLPRRPTPAEVADLLIRDLEREPV